MRFCKVCKAHRVTATELQVRKYIQGRFHRLLSNTLRYNCTNPIKDYSKLNVTFPATKVANFISENGKLRPGKSIIYHFMLGKDSKIGCTLNVKQRKRSISRQQISRKKLVTKFAKKLPCALQYVERCLHILLVDFRLLPYEIRNETFRMDEATIKYVSEVVELLAI